MKVERTDNGWMHWCPGCQMEHEFATDYPTITGAKWTFDGNEQSPTFTPDMLLKFNWGMGDKEPDICRYALRNGNIEYHADCAHTLRGKIVPLPDIPV